MQRKATTRASGEFISTVARLNFQIIRGDRLQLHLFSQRTESRTLRFGQSGEPNLVTISGAGIANLL